MLIEQQLQGAKDFFRRSVDFSRVTTIESAFVISAPAWSCGNVIRFKKSAAGMESATDPSVLIHELGHVWQHQNSQPVFVCALIEQLRKIVFRKFDPYDYGGSDGVNRPCHLADFTTESQAQIIAEYWRSQNGFSQDLKGNPFTAGYIQNLQRLVEEAGIGTAPPVKGSIAGRIDTVVTWIVNRALGVLE